jgi:hypothetical protein
MTGSALNRNAVSSFGADRRLYAPVDCFGGADNPDATNKAGLFTRVIEIDNVLSVFTDVAWLWLYFSEGSTLAGTESFAQAYWPEN